MATFRRAIVVVADGVGCGGARDAAAYGDAGADTLGNLSRAVGGLRLPNLESLGLGRLTAIAGVAPAAAPRGAWGAMAEASVGKDTITGHWEMAGLVTTRAMATYPHGFPPEITEPLRAAAGRGLIGNRPASGTVIIDELGPQHLATGDLILYTSADSVLQIAAHEAVVPLDELYRICGAARLLADRHQIGRVIARPFVGTPGAFRRTYNRRDYALVPPAPTLLDRLRGADVPVIGLGKISDIFAGRGLTRSIHSEGNDDGMRLALEALAELPRGLLFVNLVDFDMLYGHRNDAAGFARALVALDGWLPQLEGALQAGDVVFLTADHGNDPTTPGTDHTRERVPLLAFGPGVRPAPLETRTSFCDLGQTIAEGFGIPRLDHGQSFLGLIAPEDFAVKPPRTPLALPPLIARKRDGGALTDGEIRALVDGAARGTIPDYQLAALLMAIVWRGLENRELVTWTRAMVDSGDRLEWSMLPGSTVDKHSTGGVGDKISLCLAPLCAAAGLYVPMMAGRALGHTGGTLDKLETIPGFRTALSPAEFRRVLTRAGFVLAGQSARLAPADRVLYALRDATATVESIPLIASSILSKKIAEGAGALVMDVKVGSGAFLPARSQARALAGALIDLGKRLGLRVRAVLSDMDQPLGAAIGNAAEVREAIDILRGGGPPDVRALTVRLGAEMLVLGGRVPDLRTGARRIEAQIASGAGLERLRLGVGLQGGDVRAIDDPDRLPRARTRQVLHAPRAGVVAHVDAGALGRAATFLGVGRLRKEDRISPGAAIILHAKAGTRVERGDPLCTLHYDDHARVQAARPLVERAFRLGSSTSAVRARPLVLETLG